MELYMNSEVYSKLIDYMRIFLKLSVSRIKNIEFEGKTILVQYDNYQKNNLDVEIDFLHFVCNIDQLNN